MLGEAKIACERKHGFESQNKQRYLSENTPGRSMLESTRNQSGQLETCSIDTAASLSLLCSRENHEQ